MLNINDLEDKYCTLELHESDGVRLEMTTEIVNGGRAGITHSVYYQIFVERKRIHKEHSLEGAVSKFNELTGG
jgi:hypothetical protein